MTKDELREKLMSGHTMDELFHYTQGDECLIFKADKFALGGEILYIPDVGMNGIPMDTPVTRGEDIDLILPCCYTGDDFAQECRDADVDEKYAERLFWLCDWQHPSSVLDEGWPDDDDASEN